VRPPEGDRKTRMSSKRYRAAVQEKGGGTGRKQGKIVVGIRGEGGKIQGNTPFMAVTEGLFGWSGGDGRRCFRRPGETEDLLCKVG